jgi:hypothetical protein
MYNYDLIDQRNSIPNSTTTPTTFLPSRNRAIPARYSIATLHHCSDLSQQTTNVANLASSRAGDVRALVTLHTASDADTRPLPVGASTLGAEDVNIGSLGSDAASDVLDGKTGYGDTGSGSSSGGAVFVVLFDQDSGLGDVLEGDALVGDVLGNLVSTNRGLAFFLDGIATYLDLAGRAGDGLDADAVVGVDDLGVCDGDGVDDVVVAAADGADGEAVAAGAVAAGEGDVGAAVDGEAVVLVVDGGAGDGDLRRVADVEGVGVVAALGVAVLVVDGDVVDLEGLGVVDAEDLDGAVLDGLELDVSVCTMMGDLGQDARCP